MMRCVSKVTIPDAVEGRALGRVVTLSDFVLRGWGSGFCCGHMLRSLGDRRRSLF